LKSYVTVNFASVVVFKRKYKVNAQGLGYEQVPPVATMREARICGRCCAQSGDIQNSGTTTGFQPSGLEESRNLETHRLLARRLLAFPTPAPAQVDP